MLDNRLDGALIKFKAESSIAVLLVICISCGSIVTVQHVYAGSPINGIAQPPFAGSDGKINVVGVVKNNGSMPVEVVLGLNVVARTLGCGLSTTIKEPTNLWKNYLPF